MNDAPNKPNSTAANATSPLECPDIVARDTFQAELDALRVREKAHTREGDAIAAARRRLPMVEMNASLPLTGPNGPLTLLDAFEGRRQLIAYYFMWWNGHPAAEQCEGCTHYTTQVGELSYLHCRDVTYATFCQGPYEESIRYRDFMGWEMPWYSAEPSLDALLTGRQVGTPPDFYRYVCRYSAAPSNRAGSAGSTNAWMPMIWSPSITSTESPCGMSSPVAVRV